MFLPINLTRAIAATLVTLSPPFPFFAQTVQSSTSSTNQIQSLLSLSLISIHSNFLGVQLCGSRTRGLSFLSASAIGWHPFIMEDLQLLLSSSVIKSHSLGCHLRLDNDFLSYLLENTEAFGASEQKFNRVLSNGISFDFFIVFLFITVCVVKCLN